MTDDSTPHHRDADDAHADDGPPTDAVTDEVKSDAVHDDSDLGRDDTDDGEAGDRGDL